MGVVLGYVRETAPADVQATIDWLIANKFAIAETAGGAQESFGNVMLRFDGRVVVQIVRDRLQWDVTVSFVSGSPFYGLGVLVAAAQGTTWKPRTRPRSPGMARQLPDGLSWRRELPFVVTWMTGTPDAEMLAKAANDQAREAMRIQLGL